MRKLKKSKCSVQVALRLFKNSVVVFLFGILIPCVAICQKAARASFILEGNININNGTVKLWPLSDSMYYPTELRNLQAKIQDGKFEFKGSIGNPQGFYLLFQDSLKSILFSDILFVENGEQNILCNAETKKISGVENATTKEYLQEYRPFFHEIKNDNIAIKKYTDSVRGVNGGKLPPESEITLAQKKNIMYRKSNELMLDYATVHPNSFTALWCLVELMPWGYETIYDSIYSAFSNRQKNTYAGHVLGKKLMGARRMHIGQPFPIMDVKPLNVSPQNGLGFKVSARYTLIDFWYSHCGPCIAQFPKIKGIYEKYHQKGFEIMGISVDKKTDEKDWKMAIEKYGLLWKQYWDIDGKESSKLAIGVFPSNFLLDGKGNIIAKNIEPEQLESYLNNLLSANIKKTKTGTLLANDLNKAASLEVGNLFPKFRLKDTALRYVDIAIEKHNGKYIFIDFWSSYCELCLAGAPRYKEIYNSYKGDGFEMIGVSVDKTKDINHWKKNILENKIGWNQFLDENGTASQAFFINPVPKNFLLDEKGIIIKKNILPDELERFLFSMKHKNNSFFLGDPIN